MRHWLKLLLQVGAGDSLLLECESKDSEDAVAGGGGELPAVVA